jgi:hypothetical protein
VLSSPAVDARPSPTAAREVRNFGIVMCVALAAFALHGLARHRPLGWTLAPALAGAALLVASLVAPTVVRPLERAWAALGHALGRVTTPLLLAVVFVAVVLPLRGLIWLLRRDPLALRRDPRASSYWIERRQRSFTREDFERLS